MAKAYQCDVCGQLFTQSRTMKASADAHSSLGFKFGHEKIYAILIFKKGSETPDVCDECKEALKNDLVLQD